MNEIEFNNQLLGLETVLNRFAYKLTSSKEDAKDLMQDTLLKALVHREQFCIDTNMKAWAYAIMKNTFINAYRKNTRQNVFIDKTKDLFLLNNNGESMVEPDSICYEKEINRAISGLENELRVPFEMFTKGYKYREIAKVLDLKLGTVKSRIFVTRKKLKKSLIEYETIK